MRCRRWLPQDGATCRRDDARFANEPMMTIRVPFVDHPLPPPRDPGHQFTAPTSPPPNSRPPPPHSNIPTPSVPPLLFSFSDFTRYQATHRKGSKNRDAHCKKAGALTASKVVTAGRQGRCDGSLARGLSGGGGGGGGGSAGSECDRGPTLENGDSRGWGDTGVTEWVGEPLFRWVGEPPGELCPEVQRTGGPGGPGGPGEGGGGWGWG